MRSSKGTCYKLCRSSQLNLPIIGTRSASFCSCKETCNMYSTYHPSLKDPICKIIVHLKCLFLYIFLFLVCENWRVIDFNHIWCHMFQSCIYMYKRRNRHITILVWDTSLTLINCSSCWTDILLLLKPELEELSLYWRNC